MFFLFPTSLRPRPCPECGTILDGSTDWSKGQAESMGEGDVTICMNCVSPLTLSGGRFKVMSEKDLNNIDNSDGERAQYYIKLISKGKSK